MSRGRKKVFEQYEHHGKQMTVVSSLKGKHRKYCLCYSCGLFSPEIKETNCPIANALYEFNKTNDIVSPVWECAKFSKKEEK